MSNAILTPHQGLDIDERLTLRQYRAIYAAGYRFVARYLYNEGKRNSCLTLEEAQDIKKAGLVCVAIVESGFPTRDEYFSAKQGIIDGGNARVAAKNVGMPASEPIYFTVDYDAQQPALDARIVPYFEAVNRELTGVVNAEMPAYDVAAYGSKLVLAHLYNRHLIKRSWQAYAPGWGGSEIEMHCDLVQTTGGRTSPLGLNADCDVSNGNAGGWVPA